MPVERDGAAPKFATGSAEIPGAIERETLTAAASLAPLATVSQGVRLLHRSTPFNPHQVDRCVTAGRTILGMLDELKAAGSLNPALFDAAGRPRCGFNLQVWLSDAALRSAPVQVDRRSWHLVRPKPGTALAIQLIPGKGGGGKNPIRTLLTIAVVAAAAYAGPALAPVLFPELAAAGGAGLAFVEGLITGVVAFAGKTIVDTLVPAPSPRLSEASGRFGAQSQSRQFSVDAVRNVARPFQPLPRVFGVKRIYPDLAAEPWREVIGEDVYYRVALNCGYGPLEMSDWHIGTAPIAEAEGIEMEVREGRSTDAPLTLFPDTISTDGYSADIDRAAPLTVTSRTADELIVDMRFPQLVTIGANGNTTDRTVDFRLERRPKDSDGAWEIVHSADSPATPVTAVSRTAVPDARLYVDYVTDHSVTGAVAVTLKGAGNRSIRGSDPVVRIAYRVYAREKGDESWVLQHDMRKTGEWIFGNGTKRISVGGVSGRQREIRIERAAHSTLQARGRDRAWLGWTRVTGSFPEPTAWSYETTDLTEASVTWRVTAATKTPILRSFRVPLPSRGEWDVRITRLTGNSRGAVNDGTARLDDSVLVALKHLINENPIRKSSMAQAVFRVKGNERFTGQLDRINCLAVSLLPVYDDSDGSWSEVATRNQAWCALEIMRGAGNKVPVLDTRIDLDAFAELADWCDRTAPHSALDDAINPDEAEPRPYFAYDHVIDYRTGWYRKVQDILATCRASLVFRDGKWTPIIDRQQDLPVAHLAAENVFNFRRRLTFSRMPHALRVRYETNEGAIDEVTVYDDGYDAATATRFEVLELEGCSAPDQAWREGRFWFAVRKRRRARSLCRMDIEHLAGGVGQLVYVNHHVPKWGLSSAKIVSVTTSGDDVTAIEVDNPVAMEAGKSYCARIRTRAQESIDVTVVTVAGESTTLTLATPITPSDKGDPETSPDVGDVVQFGLVGSEKKNLIIRRIRRLGDFAAEVEFVDEAAEVYTADTEPLPDAQRPSRRARVPPPGAVQNLAATEVVRRLGPRDVASDLVVAWRSAEGGVSDAYEVHVSTDGGASRLVDLVTDRTVTLRDAAIDSRHTITVIAVGPSGARLEPAEASNIAITPGGRLAAPASPVATLAFANGIATVNVTPSDDADSYGIEIRQPVSQGATLGGSAAATRTAEFTGTSFPVAVPLAGTYTLDLRARNFQGTLSGSVGMTVVNDHAWASNAVTSTAVSTAAGDFEGGMCRTAGGDIRRPSLRGTDWSGVPSTADDCANLNGLWDLADVPLSELSQVPPAWLVGPQLEQTATWTSPIVNLGQVYTGVWSLDFRAEILDRSALRHWRDVPVSYLAGLPLSALVASDASVLVSLVVGSQSDLSDGVTVDGHWEGKARYARIVVTANAASAVVETHVSDISIKVDGPDIVESGTRTIAASPITVTFDRTYQAVPRVVVTQVGGTGVEVTSVGQTSFTATGAAGDVFHYHVRGH